MPLLIKNARELLTSESKGIGTEIGLQFCESNSRRKVPFCFRALWKNIRERNQEPRFFCMGFLMGLSSVWP